MKHDHENTESSLFLSSLSGGPKPKRDGAPTSLSARWATVSTRRQKRRRSLRHYMAGVLTLAVLLLGLPPARAVDFHVATAQELQNALTLAAANGADDTIYLTNGYYIGNFNYNSAEAGSLTLQGEPGTTNTQITIDGAGTGRSLNISCSGNANITVRGITFLRNCGATSNAGLRITTGSGANVLVEDCRFISPASTSGIGLELASGLNATVRRCTVAGNRNAQGVAISGIPGNVTVESCVVTTNLPGCSVSGSATVIVKDTVFNGNSTGISCNGTTITLIGNTLSGNSAGGARCGGTTVTLSANVFTGNSILSGEGAGASCSGTVIVYGNTFTGNSGTYIGWGSYPAGGGLYCGGTVTVSNNTFTANSAGAGGGIACDGTIFLSGNTFTANSASINGRSDGSGGGAHCSGTVTLSANTFVSNSAGNGGGGGVVCLGSVTLAGNRVAQNTASGNGGGILIDGSTIRLFDNFVARNQQSGSGFKGGGVWVRASSTLDMINNTVFGNTAVGSGGGVAYQVDGVTEILRIYNNIIWGNTAGASGADVHLSGTGSRKEFMFNNAHDMYGVWDIAQNNLDVDPQFWDPVNGDYHLRSTSPVINVGTNGAPSLPATDLDGAPRIAGGTVDLGCYEFSTTTLHPADVNGDWVVSDAEYTAYAAAWKNNQTWATAPNPIPADYVTRAGFLKQNGGTYHNDGSARPVNWKPGP